LNWPARNITLGLATCWAYSDIGKIVQLAIGGDFPIIRRLEVMFSYCTDGKKPAVFRLERLNDQLIPL